MAKSLEGLAISVVINECEKDIKRLEDELKEKERVLINHKKRKVDLMIESNPKLKVCKCGIEIAQVHCETCKRFSCYDCITEREDDYDRLYFTCNYNCCQDMF